MTLDKVCIQTRCTWKSHCDLYFRTTRELRRMTILPERTADACDHYVALKQSWGVGREEEND